MADENLYAVLGVRKDATQAEIREAYQKAVAPYQREAESGDAKAAAKLAALSHAYGVLGDPASRERYDGARRAGTSDASRPASGRSSFDVEAIRRTVRDEGGLAFRRLLSGDLQRQHANDAERAHLAKATPPITDPKAQDYAAWRRSLLLLASVALGVLLLFEVFGFLGIEQAMRQGQEEQEAAVRQQFDGWEAEQRIAQIRSNFEAIIQTMGVDNLHTLDTLQWIVILSLAAGAILAYLAARKWTDPLKSRRLARFAFLVMFLTPFLLALIPVRSLLSFSNENPEARQVVEFLLTQVTGLWYFTLIGPRAIALFPGVIRSGLTVKTLLPESPMPGWATRLTAPLYAVFFLVVFTMVNQAMGNLLLVLGMACFLAAPLVYVFKGKRLEDVLDGDEVSRIVSRVRKPSALLSAGGAVLLAAFFIDAELVSFVDFIKFFLSILGNVVLLTVVGSDFLLPLIRGGHGQTRRLHEGRAAESLDRRLDALADAGFAVPLRQEKPDAGTGTPKPRDPTPAT